MMSYTSGPRPHTECRTYWNTSCGLDWLVNWTWMTGITIGSSLQVYLWNIWYRFTLVWKVLMIRLLFLFINAVIVGPCSLLFVRRAGLLLSQQDFEWRWSVPLFQCLTVLEFSFILFDLCLLITFFNFIMNYVPIVTFWIFTYHKIWILSIMFCFIWSYWIIYFLACL